jgi:signal transduction histidine kinase
MNYAAPSERLDRGQIEVQREKLKEGFPFKTLFYRLDFLVLVLNRQRQIVESYPEDAARFHDDLIEDIGLRPGEVLGCVHARNCAEGCGWSAACRYCGVALAICEAQEEGIPVKLRCLLRRKGSVSEEGVEYQVTAVPISWNGDKYILLFLEDRSDEKRRMVMERLFFHDVLNIAAGLRMHLELLVRKDLPEEVKADVHKLLEISSSLNGEIEDQKTLSGAENGTLHVREDFVYSLELLSGIVHQYAGFAEEQGAALEVRSFAEVFSLITNAGLLRRVIGNMVKNALEASVAGETVFVSCHNQSGKKIFSVWNPGVMDDETRIRVFTRSYSTKGENRGLGTYSMKLLGEGYLKGSVGFTSSEKDGTEFYIVFDDPSVPSL